MRIPSVNKQQGNVKLVGYAQAPNKPQPAVKLQRKGDFFAGVIYTHPEKLTIGQIVEDLEMLAQVGEPEDLECRVTFLPL